MKHAVHSRCSLERGLLRLYNQATAERHFEVAEHLLCALERMVTANPATTCAVEEAYLSIVPHRLPRTIDVDRSAATAPTQDRRLWFDAFHQQEARHVASQEGEPMAPDRTKYRHRVAVRRTRI